MESCRRCDSKYRYSLYEQFCSERCHILQEIPVSQDYLFHKNQIIAYHNCDWCGDEFALRRGSKANKSFCNDDCTRKVRIKKYLFLYDCLQVLRAKGALTPAEVARELTQGFDWRMTPRRLSQKIRRIVPGFIVREQDKLHLLPNCFPLQQRLSET